ncbi:uncharacterized protein LOC131040453 isoform X2 [Cryptomeria japonica]|uniref:uncharacterized protein LOC131040453 isoform X2 n=1 Tax=Cryptomeria japonica TaxID=3369 RepID=UPI0025ACF6D9|nr:uncharacterized protein LOC131040453 isoform X2 [Cryptomeria japonica]
MSAYSFKSFGLLAKFCLFMLKAQTKAPSIIFTKEQDDVVYHSKTYCSRERSRIAWKIIDEYLMPFVEEENYNLSKTCRLHAANDMFREQELHKDHLRVNEWQCGFCQKIFLSENYLEQHFDNRHQNLLNISRGNCLADMCGALHCDVMDKSKPPKTKCNLAAVDKNHHLCESLANSCFPPTEGPSARRLHDFFLRQFCDAHTCKKGSRPFTRGAGKKISLWYYAICILVMMMLPIFYCIVYMHQREMSKNIKNLKRISKTDKKGKSY